MSNPRRTPEQKAQHAAYMRQWRKDHPEESAEISRNKNQRIREDPEKLAAYRAYQREKQRRYRADDPKKSRKTVRDSYIRTKFGMEPGEYDALLANQNYGCAICGRPQNGKRYKSLGVDHDHKTGRVRGLLCDPCNRAIGLFGDSPERIAAALVYLRSYAS